MEKWKMLLRTGDHRVKRRCLLLALLVLLQPVLGAAGGLLEWPRWTVFVRLALTALAGWLIARRFQAERKEKNA